MANKELIRLIELKSKLYEKFERATNAVESAKTEKERMSLSKIRDGFLDDHNNLLEMIRLSESKAKVKRKYKHKKSDSSSDARKKSKYKSARYTDSDSSSDSSSSKEVKRSKHKYRDSDRKSKHKSPRDSDGSTPDDEGPVSPSNEQQGPSTELEHCLKALTDLDKDKDAETTDNSGSKVSDVKNIVPDRSVEPAAYPRGLSVPISLPEPAGQNSKPDEAETVPRATTGVDSPKECSTTKPRFLDLFNRAAKINPDKSGEEELELHNSVSFNEDKDEESVHCDTKKDNLDGTHKKVADNEREVAELSDTDGTDKKTVGDSRRVVERSDTDDSEGNHQKTTGNKRPVEDPSDSDDTKSPPSIRRRSESSNVTNSKKSLEHRRSWSSAARPFQRRDIPKRHEVVQGVLSVKLPEDNLELKNVIGLVTQQILSDRTLRGAVNFTNDDFVYPKDVRRCCKHFQMKACRRHDALAHYVGGSRGELYWHICSACYAITGALLHHSLLECKKTMISRT